MARTAVKGPLAFTAANNTELETYDSSFVEVTAGGAGFLEIQSNKLTHTFGANFVFVYRDGTPTYSANQYAKAALAFLSSLQNVRYGVAVRVSADTGGGQDWYAVTVDDNTSPRTTRVYKCVNGSVSTLDSRTSVTWTNGDTIEIEAFTSGANCDLRVYKSGTLLYTITDSSSPLASGKPGLYGYDNAGGGAATLDDWEAGDVTVADSAIAEPVTAADAQLATRAQTAPQAEAVTAAETVSATVTTLPPGVFTSEPLKRNNGDLAASSPLTYVAFSNPSTGAHVVTKTGLSTNGSGVFSTSDALLLSGTFYRADWLEASGQRGYGVKAAV